MLLVFSALLAAVGCADDRSSGSVSAGLGSPAPAEAASELAIKEADDGEETIATGDARGVHWRLFITKVSHGEYPWEFLCLEVQRSIAECSGTSASTYGSTIPAPVAETGPPTRTDGDPPFVFGRLEPGAARVMVELESAGPIQAEIVGDNRAHYVAALPSGASAREVVMLGSDGKELARRGFMDDGPAEASWIDSWQQTCEKTEHGGYRCTGSASGGGYASESGGVKEEGGDD